MLDDTNPQSGHTGGETLQSAVASVIEDMPIGVAVFDLGFRLLHWNAAWKSFFDLYSPHPQLLSEGAYLGTLIPGSSEWIGPVRQDLLQGIPVTQEAVPIARDAGTTYWDLTVTPIRHRGSITGFVEVAQDATRRTRARDELEQRVAERTAELERRQEVGSGLRDILSILNSSRPHAEVLDCIIHQAKVLLGAESVSVYERNEDSSETILFAGSHGIDDDPIRHIQLPTASGIVTETLMRGKPMVLGDTIVLKNRELDTLLSAEDVRRVYEVFSEYRGLLAVPIMLTGKVWGALALYYRHTRDFSEEDVALASDLAHHLALALENAALRRRCEEAAVSAERDRLARDLHDAVTQTLFSASLIADVLPELWTIDRDEALARLEQLRQLTRGASAEMRTLLLELRPDALLEADLGEVLRQLIEAASSSGLDARLHVVGGPRALSPDVHVGLYRVAQEALNNAVKHSRAEHADVTLKYQRSLVRLVVEDDGIGMADDAATVGANHMGLVMMRERVEALGGHLRIASAQAKGVRLTVDLPLSRKEQETT